ncbi:MAG: ATP-binding cassette domain-containing protein, partial [Lacipirellulaceae bacterium]
AKSQVELSLETRWPGGEAHAQHQGREPLPFNIGDQPLLVHWDDHPSRVRVEFGSQSWPLELPGRINPKQGKEVFTVRAVVTPDFDKLVRPEQLCEGRFSPKRIEPGTPFRIGRDDEADLTICQQQVAMQHCLVVRHPRRSEEFWVIDLLSQPGTFVNGQRVLTQQLQHGDFLQVGTYGWRLSASDGFLLPEKPITGGELLWDEVTVPQRLENFSESLCPGELTAIVGPSGAGKSTLVKTVIKQGLVSQGGIKFDQCDTDQERVTFRQRLGYVSQQQVLHRQLKVRQAIAFAYRFRKGQPPEAYRVDRVLRSVDLPPHRWTAPIKKLSGGEQKRVQVAAQLIVEPALFLLDEPTSGLDPQRAESLIRLLRTLCYRGGTVAVVTHDERSEWFDRTITLEKGKKGGRLASVQLAADDSRDEGEQAFDQQVDAGALQAVDKVPDEKPNIDNEAYDSAAELSQRQLLRTNPTPRQLFEVCASREWQLMRGDWLWRIVLPLLVVPGLFAVALHLAVPATNLSLLGFLSVISTIWMGASLGLLAIVDERHIVEHERLLYLKIAPYLTAKTLILWVCSLWQVSVFFGLLCCLRRITESSFDMLKSPKSCLGCLMILGCASVGLGLLLSAVSGLSRHRANFLLPLVMIGQIVFSVQVADGNSTFLAAYKRFSPISQEAVAAQTTPTAKAQTTEAATAQT